mgnify:FL=1
MCLRDALAFMAVGDDVSGGLALHEPCFQAAEQMTWSDDVSYVPTSEDVVSPEVAAAMRTSLCCGAEGVAPIANAQSLGIIFRRAWRSSLNEQAVVFTRQTSLQPCPRIIFTERRGERHDRLLH